MPAFRDLTDQVFNGITALRVSHKNARSVHYWVFRCHCGREFTAEGDKIRRGHTRSCGCIQEALKHGRVDSPEHRAWASMKRRCFNPRVRYYENYGGRGITVCEQWLEFRNFYEDMGPKPTSAHSLDRIDNDGNYEPNNCRWATKTEQSSNRRNTRKPVPCEQCSEAYLRHTPTQRFCSPRCRGLATKHQSAPLHA